MPDLSLQELLSLPPGTRQPHAYQVLGLEEGEQDLERIEDAVQAAAVKLKSCRGEIDERVWRKAARLVQQSRGVLKNPRTKAELDARFGIVTADPLEGLLPAADPLAAGVTGTAATHPGSAAIAVPDRFLSSIAPSSIAPAPRIVAASVVSPRSIVAAPPSRRRPKTSTIVNGGLLLFGFGTLALISGLVYFMLFGPGQLEIAKGDGQLTIRPSSGAESRPRAGDPPLAPTAAPASRQPHDPIMGSLLGDGQTRRSRPRSLAESGPLINKQRWEDNGPPSEIGPPPEIGRSQGDQSSIATGEMTADATNDEDGKSTPGVAVEAIPEATPEAIARGGEAIDRAHKAVAGANWAEMKGAVQRAVDAAVTSDQRRRVRALEDLTDHALYYHGGIQRALAQLSAGREIKVGPIDVIVVEASREALTIRRSARNFSYSIDELPPSLVNALASLSMVEEDPATWVSRWVYESIAPTFDGQYRRDAIAKLREFDAATLLGTAIEGSDPQRLAETIESLDREGPLE